MAGFVIPSGKMPESAKQASLSWLLRCAEIVMSTSQARLRIPLSAGVELVVCANGTIDNISDFLGLLNTRMRVDVNRFLAHR